MWPLWAGIGGGTLVLVLVLVVVIVRLSRPTVKPADLAKGPGAPANVNQPKEGPAKDFAKDGPGKDGGDKGLPEGGPINWDKKVEIVKGKMVPGHATTWVDDKSFLIFNGTFLKQRSFPDGAQLANFEGHSDVIHSVALSRGHGTRMASSDQGKKVLIWDVPGKRVLKMITTTEIIDSLAFSPDGKQIAGGGAPTVWLWETEAGKRIGDYTGNRGGEMLREVAFIGDGSQIASGGQTLRVWGVRTGATVMSAGPLGGIVRFAFTKDGESCYLATSYNFLFHKTAANERRLQNIGFGLRDVCFTPDYQRLVVGGTGTVGIVDPETGALVARLDIPGAEFNVAVSPNGRFLALRAGNKSETWLAVIRQGK